MKLHLIIVLFINFASLSLGQTPSVSPMPIPSVSPEKTKTFGSSLEKYKNKKQPDFQTNKKSDKPDDSETIRVKTDLVVSDVLVADQNGKIITGLKKDDFIVTEDEVSQKVEVFSFGENASVPRSVVFIIDCAMPNAPYLKKSIEAAKILVDKLSPQDKMAIVTVDVKLQMDFTQDKTLLKKTLDSLEKKVILGGGAEFDALLAVLNEMFYEKNRQQIIIFQGDATEIIWFKEDKDTPYPISDSIRNKSGMIYVGKEKSMSHLGFSDVKEAIERSQASIYSVATGIRFLGFSRKERLARGRMSVENMARAFGWRVNSMLLGEFQERDAEVLTAGQTAMLKVAELSGGNIDFIEKPEDAETVYSTIFKLINTRYAIGYYPTNQAQDGKLRNVKIEVRGHPEYTVTGRKAYFLK